ncbi:sugar ABC transporter permease [Microbacterium capsulatum]|uniref:Sugar ABC transporter permease n=1 Tax=Microbacterium capsulatum TaxID=3041921 RepID=A0ABU0XJ77_9MICO|nr:sugar ABC transporter permease [Microbacterium sp. ASV81]MDQ4215189.1 sugar ABC transporter permease [Microbacterium sp. ASV81]
MTSLAEKAPRRTASRSSAAARQRTRAALLLMAPFFVLFLLVTILPVFYAFGLSLFQEKSSGLGFGGSGPQTVFAGFDNYVQVMSDPIYWAGYLHTLVYAVIAVPVVLVGGIVIALLLDSVYARAKRAFQLGLFIPHLVPGVIAALIWLYLYTPQISPIVKMLAGVDIHVNLFGAEWTYPTVVNITLWEALGYNIVIYYASLQAISRDVLEAATIDGAGELRTAWSIKLPLIGSSVGLTALFAAIGAMQLFAEPLLLATGGSTNVTQTWTPNLYVYTEAFTKTNYGLAAAGSIILAVIAGGLSFALTRYAKPGVDR